MLDQNLIITIVIGCVVLGITFYLLKSIFTAIIVTLIVVIIFRVGFVYTADDVFNKFGFRRYINSEYVDDIYEKYDEYTERRDKDKIINTDEIDKTIKEGEDKIRDELDKKLNDFFNKTKSDSESLSGEEKP